MPCHGPALSWPQMGWGGRKLRPTNGPANGDLHAKKRKIIVDFMTHG